MKLIVDGNTYDITESLQGAAIGDLLKLKVKTKTPDFIGVTVKFIQRTFTAVGERTKAPGFEQIDLLGDEDFLLSMQGLIYLSRRKAGDVLEVEDAGDTPFDTFSFEADADDEVEGDDPKVPTAAPAPTEAAPATP